MKYEDFKIENAGRFKEDDFLEPTLEECYEIINKAIDAYFDKFNKKCEEEYIPFIENAKKSIKHPHFQYALIELENKKIEYKMKKWYKWFSGKREIAIKIKPLAFRDVIEYGALAADVKKIRED